MGGPGRPGTHRAAGIAPGRHYHARRRRRVARDRQGPSGLHLRLPRKTSTKRDLDHGQYQSGDVRVPQDTKEYDAEACARRKGAAETKGPHQQTETVVFVGVIVVVMTK